VTQWRSLIWQEHTPFGLHMTAGPGQDSIRVYRTSTTMTRTWRVRVFDYYVIQTRQQQRECKNGEEIWNLTGKNSCKNCINFVLCFSQKEKCNETGVTIKLARVHLQFGDRIPERARFSAPVQTCSEAHPASYTMGTGSFPEVKAAGTWSWPPTPSSAEVKEIVEWLALI
jgi:hypothetical protein